MRILLSKKLNREGRYKELERLMAKHRQSCGTLFDAYPNEEDWNVHGANPDENNKCFFADMWN